MLRRNSSNRLDRRKSTSSVHSKHDPIDPETARQHAHVAATKAFARAQERSSTDVGRGGGILRNNNGVACQDRSQSSSVQDDASSAPGERAIRRQHSVRFAGPNAILRRSIGTRASQDPDVPKTSSATLRPVAMTTNAPVPAACRPPSRSSSIGKISDAKGRAEEVAKTQVYDEYYTQEDDIASTPSSYRRVRRSKSMFNPSKTSNLFYTNGTPDRPESSGPRTPFSFSRTSQSQDFETRLRAPKSMGLLRFGRDPIVPANRERNDEAVQLARDRFFQQATQQRLREQPSYLFRSRAKRQDKPFRSSVRSSSNSYGLPTTSSVQGQQMKESGLRMKARNASENIKSKFRRIFGRSKDEPVVIPDQQVQAPESHVREYPDQQSQGGYPDIPHADEASISRVASRAPSIRLVPSNQQLRSQTGSVNSARSDVSDEKSRVTSWNSTAVNTLTSQAARAYADWEQHRLSIINENGTHISSASFNRSRLPGQPSAFRRPSRGSATKPSAVDSARVYSVLMKHVNENSPNTRHEVSRRGSVESLGPPRQIPPRTSSANSTHGNRTPNTIRTVPSDYKNSPHGYYIEDYGPHEHHWVNTDSLQAARAENTFGFTGTHTHQWVEADSLRRARMRDEDDVFSPYQNTHEELAAFDVRQEARDRTNASLSLSHQPSTKTSYHTASENPTYPSMTSQELSVRNEPNAYDTKGLREQRSTFFGGTTYTGSRTTSPYRRALVEHSRTTSNTASDEVGVNHESLLRNSLLPTPVNDVGSHKAYSESIYSRTTSGQTPVNASSTLSLLVSNDIPEMPFPPSTTGDAVIIDTARYRPTMPSPGFRGIDSAGSMEWKKWMSSEVAKLERAKENRPSTSVTNMHRPLPPLPKAHPGRHVRENAQIGGDDITTPEKATTSRQPLKATKIHSQVQNLPPLKPILKNRSAVSLIENEPASAPPTVPLPPPPPVPERSPLRPMQSRSSLRSVSTFARPDSVIHSSIKVSSISGKNVLHNRNASNATLRSVKSFETPAKLVKRNRPANTPSTGGSFSGIGEKQYNSLSSRSRTPAREKYSPAPEQSDDIYGSDGAGLMGPSMMDAQSMGSKRMVEAFLSSRRKKIDGEGEKNGLAYI